MIRIHPHTSHAIILLVALLLSVLAGCATTAPVITDHDPEQDFSQYYRYAWMPEAQERATNGDVSALALQRIRTAIETDLSSKGYALSIEDEETDFLVNFTVGVKDRVVSYEALSRSMAFSDDDDDSSLSINVWGNRYYEEEVIEDIFTEGSLAIDIFDAQSRAPVWHGYASKRLGPEDKQDDGGASINAGVKAILATFPPE